MAVHKPLGATNSKGRKRENSEREREGVSWLNDLVREKKTTEELIAAITCKIEAEPVYYRHISIICGHLHQIMKFFYRNQRVGILLFGSSVTKLALRDSDVDIYLDFGGNLPEPPEKFVKILKNQVRKFGYFIKAIPIFARVPIVHCLHRSQISCDLSLSNALGVSNSNLVKFLVSTDKRIRPLILILKFVMKSHGLLAKNAFTSYALIVLILFLLQALENPIIPSVSYIQNLATRREIVADWDTSFTTDIHSLPAVNNQLSVVDLLHKFFEFYSTFEFGFYIISSFTGQSYLKPVFSNPNLIPGEFYVYKENLLKNESFKFDFNRFMCVQGPFNHGNNITRNIMQKTIVIFQNLCGTIAATGRELLNENEENKKKYLFNLFNQIEDAPKSKKHKKEEVVIFVGDKLELNNFSYTEDSIRNEWTNQIFKSLQDILCRVMKCEIDLESTNSDNCSSSCINDKKVIKCKILHHELLSKKRNEVKSEFEFPQNISVIEEEEIISNYLFDTFFKNTEKAPLKFDLICRVKKNPTCFCIDFNSKESQAANNQLVQQIFHFIQNNVPKWIK